MLPLSEVDRETRRKKHQEIYQHLEKLYFELYRPKIISTSEGQYAVISQQENGETLFLLIENNDFSLVPRSSVCYLTKVGQEEKFKEERLKRSKKKSKAKILDSPDFLYQYKVSLNIFFISHFLLGQYDI